MKHNLMHLYVTNVKNMRTNSETKVLEVIDGNLVNEVRLDPRVQIDIYDRFGLEDQTINAEFLDPSHHLIKKDGELYYIVHFKTKL